MKDNLQKIFKVLFYVSYSVLLVYSLLNLKNTTLETCILLVALTYYINKKDLSKPTNN